MTWSLEEIVSSVSVKESKRVESPRMLLSSGKRSSRQVDGPLSLFFLHKIPFVHPVINPVRIQHEEALLPSSYQGLPFLTEIALMNLRTIHNGERKHILSQYSVALY